MVSFCCDFPCTEKLELVMDIFIFNYEPLIPELVLMIIICFYEIHGDRFYSSFPKSAASILWKKFEFHRSKHSLTSPCEWNQNGLDIGFSEVLREIIKAK